MSDDHFLTTDEVVEYLQVNLRTLYRLIQSGRLPAIRVGRQWRFRRQDIEFWLLRNRATPKRPANAPPARVLVVDDEQAVRDLLVKILSTSHYEIETAHDGASAVEKLRNAKFDLLFTDLRMPGMDGLSVIREARRVSPGLPIIIITGYSTEASAIEALNMGVQGYLTKPFRLQRVLMLAAKALGDDPLAVEYRDLVELGGFRRE